MKRDEVKQCVDEALRELNQALQNGRSDRLQQFLDVMSRFPRYSFSNCLLLAIQKPDCTMVQGFQAWKKFGRTVKKGEKGIGIIAPMVYRGKSRDANQDDGETRTIRGFKVVHVFDVSQTEGKELAQFAAITGEPGDNVLAVEILIRAHGIELEYDFPLSGADGVSKKGKIVVRPDLEPALRLAVLVHELAHEWLHSEADRRMDTTKTIRETEAEAVAHVVCRAVGIDSTDHSSDYIQLYHGDVDVLAKSLDRIQKTAARILDGMAAHRN